MIIIWTAYYFKYQLKSRNYLLGLIILFLPMALSETKISVFLIPLIFFSIIFFIPEAKRKTRYFIFIFISIIILLGTYRFIYNYYYAKTPQSTIENYIINPKKSLDYIYHIEYTPSGELNRIPQLIFAYKSISNDLKHFLFGVGAGNASDSFFRAGVGEHYRKYAVLGIDDIFVGNMLWEYGLVGTLLYFLIGTFMFVTVFSLRKRELIKGTIAIGFLGISIVLLSSIVYLNTMRVNIYLYFYWFLAGYLMNLYYYKPCPSPKII